MGKHFCFFSALYVPHTGGVERYTYNLACELLRMGHRVTVVTSNTENTSDYVRTEEGIEVYYLPCIPLMGGRLPLPKKNGAYRDLFRKMASVQYDAVVINTRFYFHSLIGARFAKKHGIPSITIEHGSAHLKMGTKPLDRLCGWYEHFVTAILKRYCKDFYGVSDAACQWLAHFGISAKGTLYNAVPETEICRILQTATPHFRQQYHLPPNAIVISYIGRLIADKGARSAVEGFLEACAETDAPIYMFVAGDGVLFQELSEKQADNLIFLGAVPFESAIVLQKESDFYVLPSDAEGFGASALEAVLCDSVVLSTRIPSILPIVKDGVSGILLKENSTQAVKEGILRALSIQNRENFAQQARQNYNSCGWSYQNTAKKLAGIFENDGGNV